jgi:hypothetical protein
LLLAVIRDFSFIIALYFLTIYGESHGSDKNPPSPEHQSPIPARTVLLDDQLFGSSIPDPSILLLAAGIPI